MQDRSTKILLAIIGIALWGLLLRPLFPVVPVQAQQTKNSPTPTPTPAQPSGSPQTTVSNPTTPLPLCGVAVAAAVNAGVTHVFIVDSDTITHMESNPQALLPKLQLLEKRKRP